MGETVKQFSVIEKQALRKLDALSAAQSVSDLAVMPGNRLEPLRGDRKGQYSIRINDQWRLCFVWTAEVPITSGSSIITEGSAMTPNRISTHPGEVLAEEFLGPLDISINALALSLRVPANRVGAIVKGKRAVSADTALRLARFFGTSPEFWMNLQAMHDLTKAKATLGKTIESDVRPRAA